MLALLVNGSQRELTEREVTTIRQRRPDSLKNGAIWGGAVGGGVLAALTAMFCSSSDPCDSTAGDVATLLALYVGGGVGIGVGIDALITGTRVIYKMPDTPLGTISISPVLGSQRQGVLLTMRFGS